LIKDRRQVGVFVAALLVAIAGTQYLEISGWVDISKTSYRNAQLDWLGVILGGLLFGIGATLAGGCATRTVVRFAEGNMQSLIALFSFMFVAAITQFGWLEGTRLGMTRATAINLQTDAGLASMLSISPTLVAAVVVLGLLAFLIYALRQRAVSGLWLLVGAVIGGLVVFSWIVTGDLAQDDFSPARPSAMTVSGPMARFGYLILYQKVPALSFAISFVLALAVASFITALLTREFKFTPVPKGMTKFAVLGGALMGIGGILAYGCNVGQGLSGTSTLSLESLLATISMFAGAAFTVKWWEQRQ
ncbi:MAG: YeeE/YedE family protein, partial [Gammaproteobacteria bacterium]